MSGLFFAVDMFTAINRLNTLTKKKMIENIKLLIILIQNSHNIRNKIIKKKKKEMIKQDHINKQTNKNDATQKDQTNP